MENPISAESKSQRHSEKKIVSIQVDAKGESIYETYDSETVTSSLRSTKTLKERKIIWS